MPWPLLHQFVIEDHCDRMSADAILWKTGSITHVDLRQTVRQIAGRLQAMGIGPGHRVAVYLPKCVEAAQMILGTLTSGATYVPIDPTAPPQRVHQLIDDAQVSLVVTTSALHQQLDGQEFKFAGPVVTISETGTGHALEDWAGTSNWRQADIACDQTAAILYTSGSTGSPKGVMLSHENISCFVDWAIKAFGMTGQDRFFSHAPFHFDLSTLDLFASMRLGACVYLPDHLELRFPPVITKVLESRKISVWYSVPTALRLLESHGGLEKRDLSNLRRVLFAGEVFPVADLRRLMSKLAGPRYANLYGPTETNVCTCYVLDEPPAPNETDIPIGLACPHLEVFLIDPQGQPVSDSQSGEICVRGPSITQGYWRQPELTDKSRWQGRKNSFRTGDRGIRQGDGTIRFLGRLDHQIKIRGHRVEILEIENLLMTHQEVAQAVVVLANPNDLDAKLVAFIRAEPGTQPTAATLCAFCESSLSHYSVPQQFEFVSNFPLVSTGKVDRQELALDALQ